MDAPSTSSWRTNAPQEVQDDLDTLFAELVPFGQETLGRHGELYPYGGALALDGRHCMLAAPDDEDEHPPSQQLLDLLLADARQHAHEYRAVGFVSDVLVGGSDALRVEVEHRSGTALTVILPYTRDPAACQVAFTGTRTSLSAPRIWA